MISEIDQQQLDELLDGQLGPADVQRLNRRLSAEPELTGELATLRAARAVRQNVFAAIAPEPVAAEKFARRVVSASRRQALRLRFAGTVRIAGGIAACIVIGFMGGWFGRGRGTVPMATKTPPAIERRSVEKSSVVDVVDSSSDRSTVPAGQLKYQVTLTDQDGHVLGVQKFDSIEDANAFTAALAREAHGAQPGSDSQPVVYAEQF